MARIPGLSRRGGSYSLRIVLPLDHPLRSSYRNGRWVQTLGACTYREAVKLATRKRAEILTGLAAVEVPASTATTVKVPPTAFPSLPSKPPKVQLRDVYDRWVKSKPRTDDTIAACGRALSLFEQNVGIRSLEALTRAQGDEFRGWLQTLPTTSKTARDRLNWVKVLLKFAAQDLELIPKSPWVGLDIKARTTIKRAIWSNQLIEQLLAQDIWQKGILPSDKKAGGIAAYWIPLLALYTGARCSELCQLRTADISTAGAISMIRITDEGDGQRIKSDAGHREVPVHSELIRLGFLEYARSVPSPQLWPNLPQRQGKAGGFFSQYFGTLRRELGLPAQVVFHSFRHTVRTTLAEAGVAETATDMILGHETPGSVGHGHIKISKSGSLLERGLIDTAVFQTNRIDYCAPGDCHPPLIQRRPEPDLLGNARMVLDTATALPDLTQGQEEQYLQLVAAAKALKEPEAKAIQATVRAERIAQLVSAGKDSAIAEKMVADAFERRVLGPDFGMRPPNPS